MELGSTKRKMICRPRVSDLSINVHLYWSRKVYCIMYLFVLDPLGLGRSCSSPLGYIYPLTQWSNFSCDSLDLFGSVYNYSSHLQIFSHPITPSRSWDSLLFSRDLVVIFYPSKTPFFLLMYLRLVVVWTTLMYVDWCPHWPSLLWCVVYNKYSCTLIIPLKLLILYCIKKLLQAWWCVPHLYLRLYAP